MQVSLVGQAYQTLADGASPQRCVNWYLETNPAESPTAATLYPTPGLTSFCATSGKVRAMHLADNRLFVLSGNRFSEIVGNAQVLIGPVLPGFEDGRIIDNGLQVLVLTSASAHVFNLASGAFTAISNTTIQTATQAVCVDGYGVFLEPNSQRVRITSAYDFSTVDDSEFASTEGLPDNTVGISSLARELWIFGDRSAEIWFNSGNAEFPFEKSSNTYLEFGCAASQSISKMDSAIYWLGRSYDRKPNVYRASGYQPEALAHHGISKMLEDADKAAGGLKGAYGYCYHDRGHAFYVLTLPSIEKTIVYDAAAQAWHERAYRDITTATDVQHRSKMAVTWNGRVYVSDHTLPIIYEMSEAATSDNGNPIVSVRTSPIRRADQRNVILHSLELLTTIANGQANGEYAEPKIEMRQSTDGGRSFGDWRSASTGRVGESAIRVLFRRLGIARNRVIEVRMSGPVRCAIHGATAQEEVLTL